MSEQQTQPQNGVPTTAQPQTIGEFRVGKSFNPSGASEVDELKRLGAAFIDALEKVKARAFSSPTVGGEIFELCNLAQREAESACMWAVKAATKR
jgi:hypothetical protein